MKTIIATTVLATAAALTSFAHAGVSVKLDNADLATAEGRVEVYARLEAAALNYCATEARQSGSLASTASCRRDVMDEMIESPDDDRMAALHDDYADYRFAGR